MCFLGGNPLYMCHNDKMYTNYMEYVLLHLKWENILNGVVRQGIAQFFVAFSYVSASWVITLPSALSKRSWAIFLYFACCWDFSGTSVHTWSVSHNFYICVHCCCNILSNLLTVAYCHALHFSVFGLVAGYVFGSSFICTFFTHVWKLPNPHRNIVFIVPSLPVYCYTV